MCRSAFITIFFSLLISACATAPAPAEPPAPGKDQAASSVSTSPAPASAGAVTPEAQPASSALLTGESAAASIYFERDLFTIPPEYLQVVRQQAEILKQNGKTVTLEGNADERGSSEYNLALGDRRAQAVGKSLQFAGVPHEHINVISLGEERPRKSCHEEICWHENRRVDFRY